MAVITSTAATNSEPTSISTNALVGEAHAIDTALDDVKDKRSLRSNQVREDNGGLEQDSEERLDATALAKLLRGHTNHKLELWKRDNHIAADVWKKLDVDNNPGRRWIYDNFMNHIGHGKQ
ncbi:Hypothetical protein PHPALM_14733 [Phytophthora palmivora]|uniref:RxLR effector protein n=1 Tax=Phytophthora palmivora TaxID=4796 RepID=A0A2P4XU16_9STRA|nr:Hypothetical protein PHPALM_14733 [Phytophthora palmivora]